MPDDVTLPARASNRDLQTMRFEEALEVYTPSLADALPDHIPLQRFKRVLLTAVNLNPDLARADRRSLFNSCVKCAHDGLYPDGREAALVVYRTSVKTVNDRGMDIWQKVPIVQYLPMIAGIRKRMRNSGEVLAAIAEVVYRNDKFRVVKGIDGRIEHEPPPLDEDRGEPVGAYAQIKLRTGEVLQEVMTKKEILYIRDTFSRGADGAKPPWKTTESEMWRKTVLRRCAKSAPSDSDLDRLLARDEEQLYEPHPATLPPPRPTRDQFTEQEQIEQWTGPLPENAEDSGMSQDRPQAATPIAAGGATQADPPQRRRRRTKAEMEAARAAAEAAASSRPTKPEYVVIDALGEIHEYNNTTDAANYLRGLFTEAAALGQQAIDGVGEDNSRFLHTLSSHDPVAFKFVTDDFLLPARIAAQNAEWTAEIGDEEPATTESPSGTDDAPEPASQPPAPSPSGAGGHHSYVIEPVYEKNGEIAKAWWVVLLMGKLRSAKSRDEYQRWIDANANTIERYKEQLRQKPSSMAFVAALKEIDDLKVGLP